MRYAVITALIGFVTSTAHAAPIFNGNPGVPAGEASGMQVLYELNIPGTNPAYRNATPVPYTTDNSGAILAGSYSRVGYYVEVNTGTQAGEFVYISMDSFDPNPASLGLPHNLNNPVARQTIVNNSNIFSNNASIVTGLGVATANLEMWPSNYGTGTTGTIPGGSGSLFDFNDSGFNTGAGHAAFQIHNHGAGALQTLFGWSDWGGNSLGAQSEFGIGNATLLGEPHPDWTFSDRGQTGFLQIVVGTPIITPPGGPPAIGVPEPTSIAVAALGLLGMGWLGRRRRKRA